MVGHFFVIDGPDGAGKSTQIGMLKDTLSHRYGRPASDFIFTREPGGSPFAEMIRKIILSDQAEKAHEAVMVQLFGAARFDHLVETVIPALEAGKTVISDRFDASTYTYQIVAGGGNNPARALFNAQRKIIEEAHSFFGLGWTTILLDVVAKTSKARAKKRAGEKGVANHFDRQPLEFYQAVREGYQEYAKHYPEGICVIDASRTPALVHHDVIAVFDSILGGPSSLL